MTVVVMAALDLPAGALDAWRAASLDPSAFGGWFDEGDLLRGDRAPSFPTVGALLSELAERSATASFTFGEAAGDREVRLLAGLHEEADLDRYLQDLCVAVHAAHRLGAKGSAFVFPLGAPEAIELEVRKKKAKLAFTPSQALFEDTRHAMAVILVNEWLAWRSRNPEGSWASFRAGEARYWLPDAPTPAEARVLAAVEALPDDRLEAALRDERVGTPDDAPLGRRYASAAALRAGLAAKEPPARVGAVAVLAKSGAPDVEALARGLLDAESEPLRVAAVRALASVRSRDVFDALLAAVRPGRVAIAVDVALTEAPAEVEAMLAAALEGPLLQPSRYEGLFAGEDEPSLLDLERARVVLSVVGARRLERAVPRLEALFLSPERGALVLRRFVVGALLQAGGEKMEREHGERIQAFALGMGLALNQDLARRSELLGIAPSKAKNDYESWGDVDLPRLEALVKEGFLSLEARQNDAPSTEEFLAFARAWPEVRAHGYAIGPKRADYRVMVEGLHCALGDVAPARREPLRAAFLELCREANQLEAEGDDLHAWWT